MTPLVCSKLLTAPLLDDDELDEDPDPVVGVAPLPPAPFVLPWVALGCEGTVVPVKAAAAQEDAAAVPAAAFAGPLATTVAFPLKEQDVA